MRIKEITTIKPIKPLTPEKARINSLKQQKERAATQLKTERERQKKATALANISKNNAVLSKLNNY